MAKALTQTVNRISLAYLIGSVVAICVFVFTPLVEAYHHPSLWYGYFEWLDPELRERGDSRLAFVGLEIALAAIAFWLLQIRRWKSTSRLVSKGSGFFAILSPYLCWLLVSSPELGFRIVFGILTVAYLVNAILHAWGKWTPTIGEGRALFLLVLVWPFIWLLAYRYLDPILMWPIPFVAAGCLASWASLVRERKAG